MFFLTSAAFGQKNSPLPPFQSSGYTLATAPRTAWLSYFFRRDHRWSKVRQLESMLTDVGLTKFLMFGMFFFFVVVVAMVLRSEIKK